MTFPKHYPQVLLRTQRFAIFPIILTAACGNPSPPQFIDVAAESGLTFNHIQQGACYDCNYGPGVAVADFNRDGFLDLLIGGGIGQNAALYMNQQDGTFVDASVAWQVNVTAIEMTGIGIGDIDDNGYPDFIAGSAEPGEDGLPISNLQRFNNTGSDQFTPATTTMTSVAGVESGVGIGLGDFELDGDLDLISATWSTSLSFHSQAFVNDGSGNYTEQTAALGFDFSEIWGYTPTLVDIDGDFYPELLMTADFLTSQYYRNDTQNGQPSFTRLDNGTGLDENGMGAAIADIDNDGDLDWFVTSIYHPEVNPVLPWSGRTGNKLYRNDGNHQYTEISTAAGVADGDWGWGTSFSDFNHDGLLDLVMTNGFDAGAPTVFDTDRIRLWLATGLTNNGPTYNEVALEMGINNEDQGRGLVCFDADNDGDLDILVTNNRGPVNLYRNGLNPAANTWLQIELLSPNGTAPDGIGAAVTIQIGDQSYHKPMISNGSFMSQEPLRLHFGFPATTTIDQVNVEWPNGLVTNLTNVQPGQILVVNHGDINGDNAVNSADLALATDAVNGVSPLNSKGIMRADLDRDGDLDSNDLVLLSALIL